MTYIAVKNVNGKNYFFVARSFRGENGKPEQKILESLGDSDKLLKRLKIDVK
jgi:hypothetical protein